MKTHKPIYYENRSGKPTKYQLRNRALPDAPPPVEPPAIDPDKLIVGYRVKGTNEHWVESFINVVHPNIDAAQAALPAWLIATDKYMGETVREPLGTERYYPTRGEAFDYAVVRAGDATCHNWHYAYIEDLGYVIHQPMTEAEIQAGAAWQN
jgi:hypothetical protein